MTKSVLERIDEFKVNIVFEDIHNMKDEDRNM